jgi:hypothetical protein
MPGEGFLGKFDSSTRIHVFRPYTDEDGNEYYVSLCGKREEPQFVRLVDTFATVTCGACEQKR